MRGMKANLVVFLSMIHASIHVHNVVAELVTSETGVQCSDCQRDDPDAKRNVTQLITSKGYPCEDHVVTTADGFILSLQRIPYGKQNSEKVASRVVVFLQHGLLDSSATWVENLANQSLGFILSDAGFDVWMGNVRGNTYSRAHVKYNPSDAEFWEWSWDDMARYDLPTMLNYVLRVTGRQKLSYIGHSQGTLIAFAQFSHDHVLASKVQSFIALGPIVTVGHIQGVAKYLSDAVVEEKILFEFFGIREFLPNNRLLRALASHLCNHELVRSVCENFVFLICGFDNHRMNITRLPVYFSHTPAGTSVQNMVHFAQMAKSNLCQAYNYGSRKKNFLHYNQSVPPVYNVSALTVPTYIFSGANDYLSDPKDVRAVIARLHSVVFSYEIPNWQHLDFIWGLDAARVLYDKIVHILLRNAAL